MKKLHNTEDSSVLRQQMMESDEKRVTISFYKYWQIGNPQFFRDYLFTHWSRDGCFWPDVCFG